MITKFNKYKLITENPDSIYVSDEETYYYQDNEAIPFFCITDYEETQVEKIYFGKSGESHADIPENNNGNDNTRAFPGRLWRNGKIIAFWVYPNEQLFTSIIKYIENALNIKIFNNGWRMEVIKINGELKRKKEYQDKYMNSGQYDYATIIPIEEFAGSENVPEEQQIMHLMNWKEKELAKKIGKIHFPKGFGSDKTAWDSPNNIKWRQAKYQENKIYR